MSKKSGLIIVYSFILIFAIYLAYDAFMFGNSMNYYLTSYLSNFQTYLFVFNILLVPIILLNHVDYVKAEYLSRIKPYLFKYIIKKSIFKSLQTTFVIYFCFIVGGLILRLNFELSNLFTLHFIQLFFFILSCFLFYHAIYVITTKLMISLFCITFINLAYSSAFYALGFIFISDNEMFYKAFQHGSLIFITFIMITSIVSLFLTVKNKEWYS